MSWFSPRSFRWRVWRWLSLASCLLTSLIILGFTIVEATNLSRLERHRMRAVAAGVAKELNQHGTLAATKRDLQAGLAIFYQSRGLWISVYTPAQKHLFTLGAEQVPIVLPRPAELDDYTFKWLIFGYENWVFRMRFDTATNIIMIQEQYHTEVIERLLVTWAAATALGLGLSLLLGSYLSRKVVEPIGWIGEVAGRIYSGQLSARIAVPEQADEIQALVVRLNAAFGQLEASFDQASRFSANVAHELRTPLTAIRGHVEVCLRRPRSNEEYQQTLAECGEEIRRLQAIVDTLLLVANPNRDAWREGFVRVDWSEVCREVLARLEETASSHGVRIDPQLAADVCVVGTKTFLGQMVHNLVHNALKFSPSGGTVEIRLRRDGETGVLEVSDTGCGIAPEHHERIFDYFFQVDTSRHVGAGLGLCLVRWIAELHQGNVTVASELGKGARFTICLPLAPLLARE